MAPTACTTPPFLRRRTHVSTPEQTQQIRTQFTRESILEDYRVAYRSRQVSLIGRREVLTGKAKFGIFGDGKEVAQLALAKVLRPGDFRPGAARAETLMFVRDLLTVAQFFAQRYADPHVEREPCSAGRSMNAHFSTC